MEITFIDTGLETLKGGRIKEGEKYIKSENFHLTYNGVRNMNLDKLVKFHNQHGKLASVSAVRPPSNWRDDYRK